MSGMHFDQMAEEYADASEHSVRGNEPAATRRRKKVNLVRASAAGILLPLSVSACGSQAISQAGPPPGESDLPIVTKVATSGTAGEDATIRSASAGSTLAGTTWHLTRLTSGGAPLRSDEARLVIEFADDGGVLVKSGYHTAEGTYESSASTLTIHTFGVTAEGTTRTSEVQAAVAALYSDGNDTSTSTYALDQDALVLTHGRWRYTLQRRG